MITIEINEHTKEGEVLLELARLLMNGKNGVKIVEDNATEIIEETKQEEQSGKRKAIDEILADKDLSEKEKAFYRKFGRAIGEAKAVEAGKLKPRTLKEVLDEI